MLRQPGLSQVLRRRADGVGSAERVYETRGLIAFPQSWASGDDTTALVLDEVDEHGDVDIKLLSMDASREVRPLVATEAVAREAAVSPDGRWLAYASDRSGRFEVYVQSFPDLESQVQVSPGGGTEPRWTRAGDGELFYRDRNGFVQAMRIGSDGAPIAEPELLARGAEALFSYDGGGRYYSVGGGGSEFYAIAPAPAADDGVGGLVLVDIWLQELATAVPAP